MRKTELMQRIPKALFSCALLLLFFLWVGSFLNFKGGLEHLVSTFEFDGEEVFASENDFQKALIDSFLPDDSMWVEDDSAFPGEEVWITVGIRNSVRIAGFIFMITYDTDYLAPEYMEFEWYPCLDTCPPETAWVIREERTERTDTSSGLEWNLWQGSVYNKHLDTTTFIAAIILAPTLPVGSGPVVRIKFKVNPLAPQGETTPISFVPGLPGQDKPNTFADSTGMYDFYPQNLVSGTFTVKGGGTTNQCPVFTSGMPLDFYEVNQGATLEFDVTASDPDGDSLTLSMDPVAGYDPTFPTEEGGSLVTQTFSFSPTFAHTPGTILVTFKADDGQCVTEKTVSIEIIETDQDLLIASSEQGGVPGSSERMVPFIITNSIPIYGFQFTLRWDANMVDVDSFVRTDAISGFSLYHNLWDSSGVATVLVFGLAGQTIPAGIETVLYAAFSVDPSAPAGEVPLQLENAREAINPGDPSQPLGMVHGIFTIDLFGNANIDTLVDIADVVSVVAYILGDIDFTSRQFLAADVTGNDTVNVADLVGVINIILGRWSGPSPSPYSDSEPMAIVRLDYDDLQPGGTGEVNVLADLEVPVAGAQIRIDYDPEQLSFEAPRLSDWSDRFIAEYKDDKQGKLIVLLYNMSNDPISPGEGNILSLPARVNPNVMNKIKLEIGEVVLADQNAVEIPVDDGKESVPQAFELRQNYPNPFNPTTTIKYNLPSLRDGAETLPTTLKIYNVLGEVVRTLVDESKSPGVHHEVWDGKDDKGDQVASGIYFYRLRAGEFSETKKMVMLK